MKHLKLLPSPAILGKSLSSSDGQPLPNPFLYHSTVGVLQYLTRTRPNIAYIVNHNNQVLKQPSDIHWQAVKRVL